MTSTTKRRPTRRERLFHERRKQRGVNVGEAAAAMGYQNASGLYGMLRSARPTAKTLRRLADWLNATGSKRITVADLE